jgi:hypothetical protein
MRWIASSRWWLPLLGLLTAQAWGIIFYATGDSAHNTTAPGVVDGLSADTAWQMQGGFGSFLGTPIGPSHFITARHIGMSVGDTITFDDGPNAGTYTTTACWDNDPGDLRIWEISGTFPQYVELYAGSDEEDKNLLVIGRGTQRGTEYVGPDATTRGWAWGTGDEVKRWGRNNVTQVVNSNGYDYIAATFSSSGLTDEAMLSTGDSGGAVFLQEAGQWKLAGINYAVSGSYYSNTGESGSGVNAALYDTRNLYSSSNNVDFDSLGASASSGFFYSSRLSAVRDWIQSFIGPSLTQAAWRQHYFGSTENSGDGADTADPDGDGMTNLLEYAFGSSPKEAAQTRAPVPSVASNQLAITFPLLRQSLTYTVEASSDLVSWSTVTYTPVTVGQSQTVTDSVTLGSGSKRFLRVVVTPTP